MKKMLLLWLMALVVTTTAFAGEKDDDEGGMGKWAKSYAPVADAQDMGAIRLAQGGEGSVYVSSKWNTAFTFGEANVPAPEIATSSAILKYDKDGKERWGVALSGDVEVTCMTADEDGTLYAAGCYMDGMTVIDATENATSIEGAEPSDISSSYCGFVLKIAADGSLVAYQKFVPEVNAQVAAESEMYDPMYLALDPLTVTPTKIQLDGDKVCVAATYMGDVQALNWPGAYVYSEEMGFRIDVPSKGVFTLDASDLSNPQSILVVQQTGTMTTGVQSEPVALTFVATGGNFGVAFIGYGDLTTTTGTGDTKGISFATGESGELEYGMGMVMVSGGAQMNKYFHKEAVNVPWGAHFNLAASTLVDGVGYMAGTYNGQLPIDQSYNYDHNYAFITAFDMDQGTIKWTKAFAEADTTVTMLVTGEEIHLATKKGVRTIDPATGTVMADKETGESLNTELIISAAASWEDEYASIAMQDKNYINVITMNMGDDHGGGHGGNGKLPGFWENSFEPIPSDQVSDLQGVHTTTSLDGSVYVSSTYNKSLSVAGNPLPETEGLVSSMIVRYDNMGQEQWGIAMLGKAEVTAMTTDIDGALYVTGTFQDQVRCIGTGKLNEITIEQEEAFYAYGDVQPTISAFVAKVSKEGVFEKVEVFNTATNEDVNTSFMYISDPDYPIHITPSNIQVKDDKVYVLASYQGDVARLGWEGSYAFLYEFMYSDGLAYGLMQLDKADLGNPVSVAYLKTNGIIIDDQTSPVACNFLVDHGIIMPFVASGDVTLVTFNGSKDFSFEKDDEGNHEYGIVVAEIGSELKATELHVAKNDLWSPTGSYSIAQIVAPDHDGTVLVGGTFYGQFWFDKNVNVEHKTAFMTAFHRGEPQWSVISPDESEGVSMMAGQLNGVDGVIVSTSTGTNLVNVDGSINKNWSSSMVYEFSQICQAAASYVSLDGNRVVVGGYFNGAEAHNEYETGIENVPAANKQARNAARYNMAGQRVDASYKGIVITDGKKYLQR